MIPSTSSVVVPPACPAAPAATVAFCRDRWRQEVDAARWTPTLDRRERVVRSLRAAGDARAADAVGWLSLAGVLTGLPARTVGTVLGHGNPAALVDRVATMSTAGLGPFRSHPDAPPARHLTSDGMEVIDAGSRSGWLTADMAARAAAGGITVVAGHPLTPSEFGRLLRERVESAIASGVALP